MCAVFLVLWVHGQDMAPLLLGQGHGLTTVFRGQELTYEVIDGLAIHGGDIILGTADEAAASSGEDVNAILGRAFSRSLVAELGLRPLASGFRFVVDHRWVTGY